VYLASGGLASIITAIFIFPPYGSSPWFWAPALVGAGLLFAGLIALWLGGAQWRTARWLFLGAGGLLALLSPFVPAPDLWRRGAAFALPSMLALGAVAVLGSHRRLRIVRE
jgi:hypothetical protein